MFLSYFIIQSPNCKTEKLSKITSFTKRPKQKTELLCNRLEKAQSTSLMSPGLPLVQWSNLGLSSGSARARKIQARSTSSLENSSRSFVWGSKGRRKANNRNANHLCCFFPSGDFCGVAKSKLPISLLAAAAMRRFAGLPNWNCSLTILFWYLRSVTCFANSVILPNYFCSLEAK